MAVSGGLLVIWKEVTVMIQLNNEEPWIMVLVIQMEIRGWIWVIWKVELLSLGNWYEREKEAACSSVNQEHSLLCCILYLPAYILQCHPEFKGTQKSS